MMQIENIPNIWWVFNTNYIIFNECAGETFTIELVSDDKTIPFEVAIFAESQKVYVSNLLQSMFTSPLAQRHVNIKLHIIDSMGYLREYPVILIWGRVEFGERIGNYGAYAYDPHHGWLERRVHHFVNFPFSVTLMSNQGSTRRIRIDRGGYGDPEDELFTGYEDVVIDDEYQSRYVIRQDAEAGNKGVWDFTFDYTFGFPPDTTLITTLIPHRDKEGIYLRWVDQAGFLQYYLFKEGETNIKNEPSKHKIYTDYSQNNIGYEAEVPVSVKTKKTISVSAINLNDSTFGYVKSVVSSPIIHMYVGKMKKGEELWVPVTIESTTVKRSSHHKKVSQDVEFTIVLPNPETQSL